MNVNQCAIEPGGMYFHTNMTPYLYSETDFFKNYTKYEKEGVGDNWGNHCCVRVPLVFWLDGMRKLGGCPINVHCAYEPRDTGYHPMGMAVDIHVVGMSLVDQLLLALKFPFNGVGVYPHWNNPGLHVDIRTMVGYKKVWYRDAQGKYHNLTSITQIT